MDIHKRWCKVETGHEKCMHDKEALDVAKRGICAVCYGVPFFYVDVGE